jgi:hypothetical protein
LDFKNGAEFPFWPLFFDYYHLIKPKPRLHFILLLQKVFWHLTPGEPFDEGRFSRMRDEIVEVDVPEVMRYVAENGPHLIQGYKFKLKEPSC